MPDVNLGTITTFADVTNMIKDYYDRMLLETLDPETKFYQFGVQKPLPKGEGRTIIWNRPRRLGFGQKLTGSIKPSSNSLSTIKVSTIVEEYGGYTLLDEYTRMTSIVDTMVIATQELAKQAAETIDRAIVHAIIYFDDPNTATSAVHLVKSSASLFLSTNNFVQNTYSNTLIAVSDIRRATTELRHRNVATLDGQNYVGILNPYVAADLRSDTTWQNWHQYTTPEYLYRGEIGRVEGVRFVESTFSPVSAGSGNGNAISATGTSAFAFGTVIFGRGFYGVTEIDGGIQTFTVMGPSKSDPLNQTTTYGWKAFFGAKILNVSAGLTLWTGSQGMTFTASSTSARDAAGLTLSAITTAS